MLLEVIQKLQMKNKFTFCIYPTAPMLGLDDLKKGYKKISNKFDQIVAISKYSSPIQRAYQKISKNYIKFINPKYKLYRSQDLNNTYFDSGTFSIYKNSTLLKYEKKNLRIGYIELDKYTSVDINDEEDLNYATLLFKLKFNVK